MSVELLVSKTTEEVGTALDGDLTGGDPTATFNSSLESARKAAHAQGAMDVVCHLSFGDYSGNDYAQQLFLDSLIRGCDLAVAIGVNTTLDAAQLSACTPIAEELRSMFGQYACLVRTFGTPTQMSRPTCLESWAERAKPFHTGFHYVNEKSPAMIGRDSLFTPLVTGFG